MPRIEKTPAEWAKWIDEMYASAPNPAAIPDLVADILVAARDVGHDQGVEAVAAFLDDLAADGGDGDDNILPIRDRLRALADEARSLKKGAGA